MKFETKKKFESLVLALIGVAVFLAVWHYGVSFSGSSTFPSPLAVKKGLIVLASKGLLWRYIGDSVRRVALGFGAAALCGVPIGLVLGWYPASNQVLNPVVQLLRPISPIAWIPLAILFFGVGDKAAVFLIFLAAFFPIVIACTSAAANIPPSFRRAASNFGLTTPQLLTQVLFPASVPEIIVGLRLALGISWMVVVAAEMIAVDSGLGYMVIDARNSGKRYDLVVGAMLVIGIIGLALDLSVRRLGYIRSVRWGFRDEK